MSESAVFHYKLSYDGNYIDANDQMTYKWNDDKFSIKWPCIFQFFNQGINYEYKQ